MKEYTAAKQWKDGFGATSTRIMAADLIHIEDGISSAIQGVNALEAKVAAQPTDILKQVQAVAAGIREATDKLIPVGTIAMFAADTDPEGWVRCDGRLLDRGNYPKLFQRIGTKFGTTTAQNFRVPDFRERSPIGAGDGSKYDLNDRGGNTTVTLSINQMPAHTHQIGEVANSDNRFTARTADKDIGIGTNGYTYLTSTGSSTGDRTPIATATGGSDPIDVRHPYIGSIFIIRAL